MATNGLPAPRILRAFLGFASVVIAAGFFEGAALVVFVSLARIRVTRVLASGAVFVDGAFLVAKITLQIK